MNIVRIAALGITFLMLGAAAISCGDDDDDGGDEPRPTSTRGASTSPTVAAGATQPAGDNTPSTGSNEVTVTAADFSFSPSSFSISGASDTTITLNNTGDLPHTIHIYYDEGYTDALADTGTVSAGTSGEVTVESGSIEEAPELFFRCNIHQTQMQGTITVE